jgi:hypothetical protein
MARLLQVEREARERRGEMRDELVGRGEGEEEGVKERTPLRPELRGSE